MVLQIPERLKGLIQPIQSALQTSGQLVDQFSQGDRIDYASIETLIAQQPARIERATHQALLEALGIDAPFVKVGDVVHTRMGRRFGGMSTCSGWEPDPLEREDGRGERR